MLGESEKCQTLLAHGAQAITEDFLEQAIHVKQELSSPVKSLLPSPRKSHNKKIESIVRKRMIRYEPLIAIFNISIDI